jgi:hypothetical protein
VTAEARDPRPEPVRRAAALGHQVEWDPPAAMTAGKRWTCTACGAAVLDYCGNVYGSAVERTCQQALEDRARWNTAWPSSQA